MQTPPPPPHQQLRPTHLYLPPSYPFPRSLQVPDLYPPHYPFRSPGPTGFQMRHGFNQSPARNDPRIISPLPTTPLTTNTNKPRVHTPISTIPTSNLSTSNTTTQDSSLSVDGGLETVTQKQDLSSPSDELKPDVSPSAGLGLETVTTEKDWSPSDDGLPRFTQAQIDFMKSHDRVLPDDAFEHYIYRKRLPIFTQLRLDDKEGRDDTTR